MIHRLYVINTTTYERLSNPLNLHFIVRYACFNLTITAVLFIASLALRKLSQTNSNIPLPRTIYALVSFADKILPIPKSGKDSAEEIGSSGDYADVALTLNNLLFTIFLIIYLLVMVISFVFWGKQLIITLYDFIRFSKNRYVKVFNLIFSKVNFNNILKIDRTKQLAMFMAPHHSTLLLELGTSFFGSFS